MKKVYDRVGLGPRGLRLSLGAPEADDILKKRRAQHAATRPVISDCRAHALAFKQSEILEPSARRQAWRGAVSALG